MTRPGLDQKLQAKRLLIEAIASWTEKEFIRSSANADVNAYGIGGTALGQMDIRVSISVDPKDGVKVAALARAVLDFGELCANELGIKLLDARVTSERPWEEDKRVEVTLSFPTK